MAGPAVGMILGDLGADVIKVERPGTRRRLDPMTAILDRGKRCIVVNLKTSAGLALVRRLAEQADVLIENFRPGTITRLGLDPERMVARNRGLCFLSLPGFSVRDSERAGLRAFEGVIAAAAGLFTERGPNHALRAKGPAFVPMPMASAYGAAFGTLAVLAALYGRLSDGHGEIIEVPLYNALLEGFSYNHFEIASLPERYIDLRAHALRQRDIRTGNPLPEAELQRLIDPLYRSYRCADGRFFYLATPSHRGLVRRTLDMLGLWPELAALGVPTDDPYLPSTSWQAPDEGSIFALPKLARRWTDWLYDRASARFAELPASAWEEQARAAGACGTVIASSQEWLSSSHARDAGLILELDDPLLGRIDQPGPVVWFPEFGSVFRMRPRRYVDAAAIDWLMHAMPFPAPSENQPPRPALSGVRVLDLANVIAGPTIAGVLGRFGAEVVKLDNVTPGFDPFITVVLGLQAGRGKRSALLDLTSPGGGAAFERLLSRVDLVTFNGTLRQLGSLGIDIARLRRRDRPVCLLQVSAFGGPKVGARSEDKGVDEVLQAATGVMSRLSDHALPPEEFAHFGSIDVLTGVCGAVGALAALIEAASSGRGAWAATSLAVGGQLVQLPFMWAGRDVGQPEDPAGSDRLGHHWGRRIYRVADGWIFLAADPDQRGVILAALGATGSEVDDAAALEVALASLSTIEIGRRLAGLDIGLHRLADYAELRRRHRVEPSEEASALRTGNAAFVHYPSHPLGCALTLVAQCAIRTGRRPLIVTAPPTKYGADTRAVLSEVGMNDGEIDTLLRAGAAAEAWPNHDRFLPI